MSGIDRQARTDDAGRQQNWFDRLFPARNPSDTTYRADIDGLRAVAVIAVILYHFQLGASGGYVGVDLFFVISGFLITQIIGKTIANGTFTFRGFIYKRAKRILPVMYLFLAVCGLIGVLVYPPYEAVTHCKATIAQLLFVSNFLYWQNIDYFNAGQSFPLLHTCSLSVEEQYYLLYPLVLFVLYRRSKAVTARWLLALLLSSVVLCIGCMNRYDSFSYYMLPTRAWQLLLGGLLALDVVPRIGNRATREIASLIAIVAMIVAMFVFDDTLAYPGWYGLWPCLSAALLIHANHRPTLVGNVLSCRIIVIIGLMSYSLYLWHWPFWVFLQYVHNHQASPVNVAMMCIGLVLLSYLSWRLVEVPLVKTKSCSLGISAVTVPLILIITAYVPLSPFLFNDKGFSIVFQNDRLMYKDTIHLTYEGSLLIKPVVERILREIQQAKTSESP